MEVAFEEVSARFRNISQIKLTDLIFIMIKSKCSFELTFFYVQLSFHDSFRIISEGLSGKLFRNYFPGFFPLLFDK